MKFKYMKGYLKGWWPAVLNFCRRCHQGLVLSLEHKELVVHVSAKSSEIAKVKAMNH